MSLDTPELGPPEYLYRPPSASRAKSVAALRTTYQYPLFVVEEDNFRKKSITKGNGFET